MVLLLVTLILAGQLSQRSDADLRDRLDRAVQAEAPEWTLREILGIPRRRILRWRHETERGVLQIYVHDHETPSEAQSELATARCCLSVGARALKDLGDEALEAGMPGGPQSIYIRLDTRVVVLWVPPPVAKDRLSRAVVEQLRK